MVRMDVGPGASAELVVVSLRGELDLINAVDVTTALAAAVAPHRWIIVNLAGLEFIDAAGIAALSGARRLARDTGGGLLLAAPHGIVRRVLALIWDADGTVVEASVAATVACAEISAQGATPVRRQPLARQPWPKAPRRFSQAPGFPPRMRRSDSGGTRPG